MRYKTKERIVTIAVIAVFACAIVAAVLIVMRTGNRSSKQEFVGGICNAVIGNPQILNIDIKSNGSINDGISIKYMHKDDRYQIIVAQSSQELYRFIIDEKFNVYIRLDDLYRRHIDSLGVSPERRIELLRGIGINEDYGKCYIVVKKELTAELIRSYGYSDRVLCNTFPQLCELLGYTRTAEDIAEYGEKGIFAAFKKHYRDYAEAVMYDALDKGYIKSDQDMFVAKMNNKAEVMAFVNSTCAELEDIDNSLLYYRESKFIREDLERVSRLLESCGYTEKASEINSTIIYLEGGGKLNFGVSNLVNWLMDRFMANIGIDMGDETQTKISKILADSVDAAMSVGVNNYKNGSSTLCMKLSTDESNNIHTGREIVIESRVETNSIVVIPSKDECYEYNTENNVLSKIVEAMREGHNMTEIIDDIVGKIVKRY